MEFKKYQHIERIGTTETDGILIGECYVFPKIDGTNASVWVDDNLEIKAGSRNRELSTDFDNQGFCEFVCNSLELHRITSAHPNLRIYGEWLVPHTLKTYEDSAWNKFYVFDIMCGDEYIHYDEYSKLLSEFDIEFIPPICKIKNPTKDRLFGQLEKNGYLIKDGEGLGEGVVIKNYNYRNKFGRQTWAKIVRNEFKAKHSRTQITEVKEKKQVEQQIVDKYVTKSLVEKEFAKIKSESGWSSKMIPRLLNTVYHCLITEESWNFVKTFKNPTVDFRYLSVLTTQKIKEALPELF